MLLTRTECLDYLIKINMPPHIRRHCMLVAEVALFLGKLLNRNGLKLSLPLIENGALLHDVGKEKSLTTGEDHAELGARMLTGLIAPAAVRIVREHIFLEPWHLNSPVDESLLVNYSDKRVRHEEIVSIEARYLDLIERYAKTPAHRGRLIEKLSLYRRLEENVFAHLAVEPEGPEIMGLKVKDFEEGGSKNHGEEETHGRLAGGGKIG